RRHGAIETGVDLRGKRAEGDHKASRVDPALEAMATLVEPLRQVHAHGHLQRINAAEEARLLHPVTGDAEGDPRAYDLALPGGADKGQGTEARVLQVIVA